MGATITSSRARNSSAVDSMAIFWSVPKYLAVAIGTAPWPDEVAPRLAVGKWVVLEIDVEGTRAIVRQFPDAVTIFVRPETLQELERRLRSRGTESEAAIQRRLAVARNELSFADMYRYQVTNQTVDSAVDEILNILESRYQAGRRVANCLRVLCLVKTTSDTQTLKLPDTNPEAVNARRTQRRTDR